MPITSTEEEITCLTSSPKINIRALGAAIRQVKTLKLIMEKHYWPGGYNYINQKVKSCVACAYKKGIQYLLHL